MRRCCRQSRSEIGFIAALLRIRIAPVELKAAVEKYIAWCGSFGQAMPLSRFEVPKQELEAALAAWDEDYHLHRHFELIPPGSSAADSSTDSTYVVNGSAYGAIVFKESVRGILT